MAVDKMNILMVHPHDIFNQDEPWTIRVKNIARDFTRSSHRVKLCYFPLTIGEQCYDSKTIDSVECISLDRTPSPAAFVRNTSKLIRISRWADVVHFQKCHHYASIPTVIASYITGKPLHYDWDDWEEKIWYESCGEGLHSRFIGFSFKALERWLPLLADSVSCASTHLKELTQEFGVNKDYIFDSPVGADLDKFKPDLDGRCIKEKYNIKGDLVLYLGQLHGAQYVDLFIKAANRVLHEKPDAKFMIVGDGYLVEGLKKMVYDYGLTDKVIFTGTVPREEVPYYISSASICVASFRETEVTKCKSPLKIVEYMASGKPVIASSVGEVRRMVGGAGILVDAGDDLQLAEKILLLLNDKALRDRLGKFARTRAEKRYSWSHTSESILSAYKKISKVYQ